MKRAALQDGLALAVLFLIFGIGLTTIAQAGVFIGADAEEVDRIVHPRGYVGVGGTIEIGVCLNPDSGDSPVVDDIDDLLIPTLNAIASWNRLEATEGNVINNASNVPSNKIDYESVLVHEIGHCIGLGHSNQDNFTAAAVGPNGVKDEDAGADGVRGSSDDVRGDDINLHWFFKGINDPFAAFVTADQFTYTRDLVDLPSGHRFATMASEQVSTLLGYAPSEAVMQVGAAAGQDHRGLSNDDVAMIEFAASGLDETAGTSDDHELRLKFAGITTNADASCQLMISFQETSGIASCGWSSIQIQGDHHRMNSINIRFVEDVSWHYGQELTSTEPVIWVTRTASRTSLEEPGGQVRFTLRVRNGPVGPVTLDSLVDDIDGDLDGVGNCSLPQTIPASGSYQCSYVRRVEGNAGDVETSTTTASATDPSTSDTAEDSDSVSVELTDSEPAITLTRTTSPTNVPEPGRTVTFAIEVANLTAEALPLTSLVDDVHGDLDGQGTCSLGTVPGNGTYQCSYDLFIGGVPGDTFTSTMTATVEDDEGNTASGEETNAVSITAGAISITKTVDPTVVDEPSGEVTYTIEIENTSDLTVRITSIFDELFGELTGEGSCESGNLAAGAVSICSFGSVVSGNGGEVESSFVTVSIIDGNDNVDSATDSSSVSITDLQPTFTIEKTADDNSIVEPSDTVEFTVKVTNTSTEDLVMTSIVDGDFGDLDERGTCRDGRIVRVGIPYFCTFTATVSGNAGEVQASSVIASLRDDDGNSVEGSSAAAPVSITDQPPAIAVQVTPPSDLSEPGGALELTVQVENATAEDITLTSLSDSELGDLDGLGTCALPQPLFGNGSYTCSFSLDVSANAGDLVQNTVSATAFDDEGGSASADGSSSVTLLDVLPSLAVASTPFPDQIDAPGANVIFTVRIDNTSVEAVSLTTLVDSLGLSLDGQGTCSLPQTINIGNFYECSYSAFVGGAGGDQVNVTFTATVSDDEANSASESADSSIDILLPANATDLRLTSDATPSPATSGEPLTITVVVSNQGPNLAEDVVVTSPVPANTSLVSAPLCSETTPGELTCDLATINADASTSIEINLQVDEGFTGELSHTATVTSSSPEAAPGDETATQTIEAFPADSVLFFDGFESGDTSAWSGQSG